MVRIEDFHIQFDEKWAVYHPGDQVTGSVHLRLNDKVFVDSIVAHFYGQARVMWITRETKDGAYRAIPYSSETVYFNEKTELWHYSSAAEREKAKADNKPIDPLDAEIEQMLKPQRGHLIVNSGPHIKAGSHSFNFSFRLPPNLPTSFDAKHSDGYIRYSIKVCMMANESIKHSRKAYFSVVKQEDLNLMSPMLREPMFEQTSKLCKNGLFGQPSRDCPIRLSATMEKRGYVPGEPIYVQVEVENRAKKSMKTFKMHLMQHVLCHVDQPEVETRRTTVPIATVSKVDKLRQGGKTVWHAGPLYIPAVVPTFSVENSMEVKYTVLVEAYRDQDYPKLHLELPIVIGTVPLREGNEKSAAALFGNAAASAPALPPPLYDTIVGIPPPSYEESVTGMTGGNDKDEENSIPRYVVYNYQ